MSEDSNAKTNFPHKLLLTNTKASRPRRVFVNDSSANIKFSKIRFSKMTQSGVVAILNLTIFGNIL